MTHSITERTIALAALFQAAKMVHQIASSGSFDDHDQATCLQSLFRIDAADAEEIYDGNANLTTGLRTLSEQLGGRTHPNRKNQPKNLYITKYVAGVLVLERQLAKNPQMLAAIRQGIERAQHQAEHFSLTHENVIASLAHLYTQTISTLKPRIMIQGEHVYLGNDKHANRIRALLLAAIRAAVLWRQCGGTRWQLFFGRRAIVEEANRLLHI